MAKPRCGFQVLLLSTSEAGLSSRRVDIGISCLLALLHPQHQSDWPIAGSKYDTHMSQSPLTSSQAPPIFLPRYDRTSHNHPEEEGVDVETTHPYCNVSDDVFGSPRARRKGDKAKQASP